LVEKIKVEKAKIIERLGKLESVSTVGVNRRPTQRCVPNTKTLLTPRKFGQAGADSLGG
jgi:hypothetical protein